MSDPEIVCGPVLRRATPTAVSVFLALREQRKVTVRVYSGETAEGVGTTVVQEGTAQTVRLGERLHVVTVTTAVVGAAVAPGADLRYQVFLGAADGTGTPVPANGTTLFTPGVLLGSSSGRQVVSYELPGRTLPGFQVAPDDPAALRVLHGGDRGPDGEGRDALATADRLVRDALTDSATGPRPHLLVLTGDQVRTDDGSAFLLALVRATAAKWGLAHDPLPGLVDAEQPAVLGPHRRAELAGRIGLRATNNHLLSFAEHVAVHLLTLSDAAWPELPAVEAVHPDLDWTRLQPELRAKIATGAPFTTPPALEGEVALYTAYLRAKERATAFHASLRAARRAMANVPVLTTMGEHDAAPGWNASRAAATKLSGNAAGRRVLANALSANAVVHAWGDTPEQFEAGRPGAQLLDRLKAWLSAPGPAAAGAQVDDLVGVPSAALARPAGALAYTWALVRDRWQLLVVDTQTDRGYPAAVADAPAPLRDESVVAALRLLPAPAATTMTLVVSAVPLLLTQPKEWADPTVRPYSWSANPASLHFTMTKLTTEQVPGAAGKRTRRVVVLSGGQEHGSAARLRFSAKAPAYDSGADAVEAVVGQVTAAPLRHTTPLGRRLHLQGYDSQAVLAPWRDFVGWDQVYTPGGPGPAQKPLPVGVRFTGADRTPATWTIAGKPQLAEVTPDHLLQLSPQWAWRTEYLRSVLVTPPDPAELVEVEPVRPPWENDEDAADPDAAGSPAEAPPAWNLARFRRAAHNHAHHRTWWAAGTDLVGENALGDLTFTTVPAEAPAAVPPPVPGAVATVRAAQWWWADDGKGAARRTRFDVQLDPRWGWYDGDRYGGRALRRGDFDARPGVQASYWGVRQNAGTHVADLQRDLAELGFAMAGRDPAGRFENHTQWAVREFQIYARLAGGVREKVYAAGAQPARYVDRLERVEVPSDLRFDRPEDKVTGVVDRNTRRLIGHWVANRWRCPVVIEAMVVNAGNPAPPAAGRGNLWHHTEPGVAGTRAFATDFTGRYGTPAVTTPQPASTDPAGGPDQRPPLVILSGWTDDHTVLVQREAAAPNPKPKVEAEMDGGQWSRSDTMWASLEMKPQTMLTGNPTVATLVSDIANPVGADQPARDAARLAARRRLSTYKVIRSVAEVEAIGFFDGINGYDNAFLSMGPCHWTMGKLIQEVPVPAPAMPGPHMIAVGKDWRVEAGEFWGFLALLEHLYPQAFHAHFGRDGIRPAKTWTSPTLWDSGGRKYATFAVLTDDLAPKQLTAKVREYDYFHSWHAFYRMLMAVRTDDDVRRAMYRLAGQRICDVLAADWPTGPVAGPDAEVAPPNTTPPGGAARPPRIGEVVNSEWGVALLYRWHILSPAGLFSSKKKVNQLRPAYAFAVAGECATCAAADKRHPIDPWSPSGGPRVGPDFTTDPATWGDAHEHALVAGVVHRANHHSNDNMKNTINTVRNWPAWFGGANPSNFTLEVNQLPVPGGAGVDPAVFGVSERQLKHGRGSFLLDSAGLPYPNGRAHTAVGGAP